MKTNKPVKKTFALDIFDVLSKLSTRDTHLWEKLTEEEQKSISPLILMRWMSGTSDMRQIIMLNEFVNPYVFNIGATNKQLMMKLLAIAASGQPHRYKWNAMKKSASKLSSLGLEVLKQKYEYSTREAKEAFTYFGKDDIISIAEDLGWQLDELKKLKKELG